jgi:hypothetical protein
LFSSGLVKFESLESLRSYIRGLLSHYEKEADTYSEKVGTLMRANEEIEKSGDFMKGAEKNWRKVGMVYVNSRNPLLGTLEVMLEALEDYRAKVLRTSETLKKFEELEEMNVPKGSAMTLYLRNGVPLRIVIDTKNGSIKTKEPAPIAA